jgi:hypothetical protein
MSKTQYQLIIQGDKKDLDLLAKKVRKLKVAKELVLEIKLFNYLIQIYKGK